MQIACGRPFTGARGRRFFWPRRAGCSCCGLVLRDSLPCLSQLMQQRSLSDLGFVEAREGLTSDRLVSGRLGAQLSVSQGLSLELVTESVELVAQGVGLLGARRDLSGGWAASELDGGCRKRPLPQLVSQIRNLGRRRWGDSGITSTAQFGPESWQHRITPMLQRGRQLVGRAAAEGGSNAGDGGLEALVYQGFGSRAYARSEGFGARGIGALALSASGSVAWRVDG
jgi:hypothetical protein